MKVHFEWQVGSDDGRWETIAETQSRRRLKGLQTLPWWGWGLLIVAVIAMAVGGYVVSF